MPRGKRNKLLSENITKDQTRLPEEVILELKKLISNSEILIIRSRPKETFLDRGLSKESLKLYHVGSCLYPWKYLYGQQVQKERTDNILTRGRNKFEAHRATST